MQAVPLARMILLMEEILHQSLKSDYSSLGPLGGARFHPSTVVTKDYITMCADSLVTAMTANITMPLEQLKLKG